MFEAVGELAADRDAGDRADAGAVEAAARCAPGARVAAPTGACRATRAEAAATFAAWPAASLLSALRATDEATEALRGNVAPSLVLEHLVLTLREVRA